MDVDVCQSGGRLGAHERGTRGSWILMRMIVEREALLSVDRGVVILRDADCDDWSDGGPLIGGEVVTQYGYGIELRALSAHPRLALRVWSVAPEPCGDRADEWDGVGEYELRCPSGQFLVQTLYGGAGPEANLPDAPGLYGVRIAWRDRQRARDAEDAVYGAHRGGNDELFAALDLVRGIERYRVDVWRRADLPPDEDDEDDE
jgi:hypothetical protein